MLMRFRHWRSRHAVGQGKWIWRIDHQNINVLNTKTNLLRHMGFKYAKVIINSSFTLTSYPYPIPEDNCDYQEENLDP